jgi:hypothetical protein
MKKPELYCDACRYLYCTAYPFKCECGLKGKTLWDPKNPGPLLTFCDKRELLQELYFIPEMFDATNFLEGDA